MPKGKTNTVPWSQLRDRVGTPEQRAANDRDGRAIKLLIDGKSASEVSELTGHTPDEIAVLAAEVEETKKNFGRSSV